MKKKLIITGIVSLIVILSGMFIYYYHVYKTVNEYSNLINPGVNIENVDVSGKTVAEAKKIVLEKYQTLIQNKKINIKVNDKAYSITYGKLEAKYDTDKVVIEAYNYGKNLNLYEKYKLIKNLERKIYKLKFTYNPKPLDELVNTISKDINVDAVDSKMWKSDASINVTSDVNGVKLSDAQLKTDILNSINSNPSGDSTVQAKTEVVKASVTKEQLQSINTLISSFSLEYASISSPGRVTNIQLATKAVNGTYLLPGGAFSFNNTVGHRTAEKGYQPAPVDIGNKVGMGLGGGICQVSTTLYNSILLAGIKATNRNHHSIPSIYVPLGYDATVDWGAIDYEFKNTLKFPIYIEGNTDNGNVTFNIYSDGSLKSREYKVTNEIYEEMQPQTVYEDDSTLPAGTTQVDQNPIVGHKVKVYLETYEGGNLISKDKISDDTYGAVNEVIKRGTGK